MLKVAIVDDDKRLAHKTEEYLLSYQKNTIETEVYFSPVKLLKAMEENTYDIYVLDIEMPDMNGVELATAIRERDQQAMIIFLTSHTGYMKDVFKVHTFDYLVKPVTQEKVHELLERALNYLNQDTFTIRFNARTRTIPQMNIFYIEKKVRKVYIYTTDGTFEMNISMEDLITQLNGSFVQTHTSFIVNMKYIVGVVNQNVLLLTKDKAEVKIPLSRKYIKQATVKIFARLGGAI